MVLCDELIAIGSKRIGFGLSTEHERRIQAAKKGGKVLLKALGLNFFRRSREIYEDEAHRLLVDSEVTQNAEEARRLLTSLSAQNPSVYWNNMGDLGGSVEKRLIVNPISDGQGRRGYRVSRENFVDYSCD